MTRKSIIIIGAGLSGLSAGCYAQMNSYQSCIFEHHTVPGGVAATWKRNGYIIDGGIHFVMGHKPSNSLHELYRELGITQAIRFVDMTTYGRFIDEASGNSVQFSQDLSCLASDLKTLSPVDASVIDEIIAGARGMQGHDLSTIGMSKPPELITPLDRLKEMWQIAKLYKYFSGKYSKPVAEFVNTIHTPWLRECIKNIFLPEVPVWFIFMILAIMADGQAAYLAGGCLDFVLAMEKHYKKLGGQVTHKSTVHDILVENDRVVGVRLANGNEHHADYVISTGDGYNTIFKMLNGRYANRAIRERYDRWKLSRPLIMVSYGVAREFPNEPPFTLAMVLQARVAGKRRQPNRASLMMAVLHSLHKG